MKTKKIRWQLVLSYIIIVLIFICISGDFISAAEPEIYFLDDNYSSALQPEMVNNKIMVQAGPLAEMLGAYIEWQETLQTIELIDEKNRLRFMVGSSYYEIDGETKKAAEEVYITNNTAYLPLEETVRGLGYLVFSSEKEYHIFKPRTRLGNVYWQEEGKAISLEMTESTDVQIITGDDPNSLIIELDGAVLAEDFADNISDRSYQLGVREISQDAALQLILSSRNPLAVSSSAPVNKREEIATINLSPALTDAYFTDNSLVFEMDAAPDSITTYTGEDPGQMVVEIPHLTVSDINLDLSENEYFEVVEINYYYQDPVFTRIRLVFKAGKYFAWDKGDSGRLLEFYPVDHSQFLALSGEDIQKIRDLEPDLAMIFELEPDMDQKIEFAGGSGTEEDPFLVENSYQLNNIRHYLDKDFRQIADINLSNFQEEKGWQPLGNYFEKFTGSYDGNNYTISNLKIERPDTDFVGLFGYIDSDSVIESVILKDVDITGQNSVGALAGRNWQGNVITSSARGMIRGERSVGGLIGYNFAGGSIQGCYAEVEVAGSSQIGGLVGYNQGIINNSYAAGGKISGEEYLGGLVGYNSQGKIARSYAAQEIDSSSSEKSGGLVGRDWEGLGSISYSFYDQDLAGENYINPGKSKSTAKMQQRSTFEQHWDFIFVWQIDDGQNYPFLRWSKE